MPLLASWYVTVLATLFVFICLLMMGVILIQKPRGGGLSGAFGGAGGNAQSAFGAKTGDFLTWLTVGFFVVFLLTAILLTWAIPANSIVPAPVVVPPTSQPAPASRTTPPDSNAPTIPAEEIPTTPETTGTPATTAPAGGAKP